MTEHHPAVPADDPAASAAQGHDLSRLDPGVRRTVTAYGDSHGGFRVAHKGEWNAVSTPGARRLTRAEREQLMESVLSPLATRARGAGNRAITEEPDPWRMCFEKDLDKIRHAPAFRRLAGKCQVFVTPSDDMIRTRLTHSIEVAQIGASLSDALGLNSTLVEAMCLGHDCGHGPGGHAAEDAFTPFLPDGFDHAVWGADVALAKLNLCTETLDGIRQHSWRLAPPSTPEGSICSWADRIAYVTHDWSDALRAGIVSTSELPDAVVAAGGRSQSAQLDFFINALVASSLRTGVVGMDREAVEVLDAFRAFNYERIYLRPASMEQAVRVKKLLTALVEHFIDAPGLIPDVISGEADRPISGSPQAAFEAVRYVASMTDRYAFGLAVELLDWPVSLLPRVV
jgi:dGTPase